MLELGAPGLNKLLPMPRPLKDCAWCCLPCLESPPAGQVGQAEVAPVGPTHESCPKPSKAAPGAGVL